ncbi:MAG: CRISPR-associated endonuclease Cas1 [Thermoprotei archaeon]
MPKLALITDYGATLKVKDGRFQLHAPSNENGKKTYKIKWDLSPPELEAIVVTVKGASISAAAVELAARHGIDIFFYSGTKPLAHLQPATYSPVQETWLAQIRAAADPQKRLQHAKLFAEGKLANQKTVLEEYEKRARAAGNTSTIQTLSWATQTIEQHLSRLPTCKNVDEVRQEEALAAKAYWAAIATLLPPNLGFELRLTRQRIRAEPEVEVDPFNRALNIGYSVLSREVWRACFIVGLNPYIGFLHAPRTGKMSLVFDLMEEFRPIAVDRPLITLAKTKQETIEPLRTTQTNQENDKTHEAFITIWREVANYMAKTNPPLTQSINNQAHRLALALKGKEEYKPYKARW